MSPPSEIGMAWRVYTFHRWAGRSCRTQEILPSIARSSLSNLGLSKRGAKCLMGNMNEGQYQSSSLLTLSGTKHKMSKPNGTTGQYSWEGHWGTGKASESLCKREVPLRGKRTYNEVACGRASMFYNASRERVGRRAASGQA